MQKVTVALSPHARSRTTTRGIMLDVIIALAPAGIVSVVLFGWKAAVLIVCAVAFAVASEWVMCKVFKKSSSIGDLSAVITGLLVAYNLPASAPWWIAAVGSIFAIVIVKMLFGGLGQNFLNPAMTARTFLLASWPVYMASFPMTLFSQTPDAVASATPLAFVADSAAQGAPSYLQLFLGNVPGSLGEVSALALLAGGIYLIARRVIDPRIPLCFLGTLMLLTLVAGGDPLYAILSGGVMLGAFFMLTDYVTCPANPLGRIVFAVGCAIVVFAIRRWSSAFPEGVTFGILSMNILTPLIERATKRKIYGEVPRNA